MLIKKIDIRKALARKRMWDYMRFNYGKGPIGYLRNNHTLNCGCGWCKEKTAEGRRWNKKRRIYGRLSLRKGRYEDI